MVLAPLLYSYGFASGWRCAFGDAGLSAMRNSRIDVGPATPKNISRLYAQLVTVKERWRIQVCSLEGHLEGWMRTERSVGLLEQF